MLPSFWSDFLQKIQEHKKKIPVLYPLLKQLKPLELTEKNITLTCSSQGTKFFLDKKKHLVEDLIFNHLKQKLSVEFVLQLKKTKKKNHPPLLQYQPSIDDLFYKAGLSPQHRLDNFAVSDSNQVAFAASQSIVKKPGLSYNPLFLYGGVGVGKTHLAQATARKILEDHPSKKVLFSPGDQFTNELIESIQSRSTKKFRKKYRKMNLLIIDDVQFIAGKTTVQEEFFHTFNSIISNGGQIILTSDKPPNKIKKLEDRLCSRFSGGLVVDVQSPNFELRTAILLIKAKEKNIKIDIEAAKILAEQARDARTLEGVLLSVYAKTLNKKDSVDLEAVDSFLQKEQTATIKRILPLDVIKAVCSYYNLPRARLKSKRRTSSISLPRQITMFLLRKKLNLKFEEIAHILKRKDHTTVIYAVDKITGLLARDPLLKQEIDQILKSLDLLL